MGKAELWIGTACIASCILLVKCASNKGVSRAAERAKPILATDGLLSRPLSKRIPPRRNPVVELHNGIDTQGAAVAVLPLASPAGEWEIRDYDFTLEECIEYLRSGNDRSLTRQALFLLDIFYSGHCIRINDALWSLDYQQRQLACAALQESVGYSGCTANARLIAVSMEGLGNDQINRENYGTPNASDSLLFLLEHAEGFEQDLVPGLTSPDHQRVFLTALILAWRRSPLETDRVCQILARHLSNNDIRWDAQLASVALQRFGKQALPSLRIAKSYADVQGQRILDLLIQNTAFPPRSERESLERLYAAGLQGKIQDPTISMLSRIGSVDLDRIRTHTW